MRIVVVIPTYNEAGAIESVLNELISVFATSSKHEWHALVVDGNSPDGTAGIVSEFASKDSRVHLLEEKEKRGLALAYASGIEHAINHLNADAFVEFDGDGQHNPAFLRNMAGALNAGADYVVGSRYVEGGSTPKEWRLYNRLLSRLGSLYSRVLLEVPVHDVTSGYKMTRVAGFAERLPLSEEALLTRDYAYKIQLLHAMHALGARIVEVPIAFRHRENGTSKSTSRDIIESLKVTAIIRARNWRSWRLLRVLLIGGFGFVLQAAFFEVVGLRLRLLSPSNATLAGAEISILSNFFFNNLFSFSDRSADSSSFFSRIARFHIISAGSVLLQWLLVLGAEHATSNGLLLRLAFIAGVGLGFIFNYLGYYFWVWRPA